MSYNWQKEQKKSERNYWLAELAGAGMIGFAILTGTELIIIPIIIIGLIVMFATGRG